MTTTKKHLKAVPTGGMSPREDEMWEALQKINTNLIGAVEPLSVLAKLFDPKRGPIETLDASAIYEINGMVYRAYEGVKGALKAAGELA